jgi:hypothetical protein
MLFVKNRFRCQALFRRYCVFAYKSLLCAIYLLSKAITIICLLELLLPFQSYRGNYSRCGQACTIDILFPARFCLRARWSGKIILLITLFVWVLFRIYNSHPDIFCCRYVVVVLFCFVIYVFCCIGRY